LRDVLPCGSCAIDLLVYVALSEDQAGFSGGRCKSVVDEGRALLGDIDFPATTGRKPGKAPAKPWEEKALVSADSR
jgi:hypothetical protein